MHVSIPVAELADCLCSTPEGIRMAIGLAERLGGARVDGDRVELPLHAVLRLRLVQESDGRWTVDELRENALDSLDALGVPMPKLPLPFERTCPDRGAVEAWVNASRDEEPPDRVAAISRWLAAWSKLPPRPTAPMPVREPVVTAPVPSKPVKPARAPSSFSLAALRTRLESEPKREAV
jgi:hypothetical protein